LQLKDRESIVPAGAACETQKGIGPGTPYFVDATPAFRDALRKVDFEADASTKSAALTLILDQARQRDTLTLWHLLPRLSGDDRARVYDKLVTFVPPPLGVTRAGIVDFNQQMHERWRQSLEGGWIGSGKNLSKKGAYGKVNGGLSQRLKDMTPK
jgi:hypothetical protein